MHENFINNGLPMSTASTLSMPFQERQGAVSTNANLRGYNLNGNFVGSEVVDATGRHVGVVAEVVLHTDNITRFLRITPTGLQYFWLKRFDYPASKAVVVGYRKVQLAHGVGEIRNLLQNPPANAESCRVTPPSKSTKTSPWRVVWRAGAGNLPDIQ